MAVRKVLRMGHPLLQEPSAEVLQFSTVELDSLIRDLFETMRDEDGAGIAAPQIGVLKRVVIFGVEDENPRYPGRGSVPTTTSCPLSASPAPRVRPTIPLPSTPTFIPAS